MDSLEPVALSGDEPLRAGGDAYRDELGMATVRDFWSWSYSRLRADVTRGALAEFIVGRLIGADMTLLGNPDREFDVKTSSGLRMEVKSSAFWQDWETHDSTKPSFSGLKCKLFSPATGFDAESRYHADLFVFCVLGRSPLDPPREAIDPLNLNQWQFFVLRRSDLEAVASPDRLSLARVHELAGRGGGAWSELRDWVGALSPNSAV